MRNKYDIDVFSYVIFITWIYICTRFVQLPYKGETLACEHDLRLTKLSNEDSLCSITIFYHLLGWGGAAAEAAQLAVSRLLKEVWY